MIRLNVIPIGVIAAILSNLLWICIALGEQWRLPNCSDVTGPGAVTFTYDDGLTTAPTRSSPHYAPLGLVTAEPNTLLSAMNGKVIRSSDAGCHWDVVGKIPAGEWHELLYAGGHVYGWGRANLFRIHGSEIIPLNSPSSSIVGLAVDQNHPNVILLGDDRGEIHVSRDGGAHWIKTGSSPLVDKNDWVNRIAVNPNNVDHIVAAGDGGAFVSKDGGNTWQPARGFPKRANVTNVLFNGNAVWSFAIDLAIQSKERNIYRSTDGGYHFSPVMAHSAEIALPNQPVMASPPSDPNILYFVSSRRELIKYDAKAHSIKNAPVPYKILSIAFSPASASLLYLGIFY